MDHRRSLGSSNSRRHRSRSRSRSVSPNRREDRSKKPDGNRSHDSLQRTVPSSVNFVCIKYLPQNMSLSILQAAVLEYVGAYVFVQILEQPGSSWKKALVEFGNEDQVWKCIRKMDQLRFGDRKIGVDEVQDVEKFLRQHGIGGEDIKTRSPAMESTTRTKRGIEHSVPTGPETSFTARHLYNQLLSDPGTSSLTPSHSFNAPTFNRHSELESGQSSQPEWLFSGDVQDSNSTRRDSWSPDEAARLEALQKKLWNSVWKNRLGKKVNTETELTPTVASVDTMIDQKQSVKALADMGPHSSATSSIAADDSVATAALEIMTGAFHIRRALEIMRKSDVANDAFRASALFLRQFNEELSEWNDSYFSRRPEGPHGSIRQSVPRPTSSGDEKEKNKNLVEVKGTWSLDEAPAFSASIPQSLQNSAAKLSSPHVGTIPAPLAASWFIIGPAQPRFSAIAAIRRGALEPLVDVPRHKAKAVLTQFARIALSTTLSRVIRAISAGAFVDLDWFAISDPAFQQAATAAGHAVLGDCGLSFANWYRCFEFVITVANFIGAPSEYLTSLQAYRRIVEMWWRQVASVDRHAASLIWLPFYEMFDKSWRSYAARSPEYRDKLHIFDAWWVFHRLDPMALKLRVPLPPYEIQGCGAYLRQVADHYEEMKKKPILKEHASAYNSQRFDTALDACSVCGDQDHKVVEVGRAAHLYCPFASRRFPWCIEMYEGVCESEVCLREGRHVCAHCGNPCEILKTCPNCKSLVT